ncbi:MAG TPA: caspase family protein [Pseudonocardiaceae bacterium]|jgi:hypothetical protein
MHKLFALVVGIDRYPPPVPELRGCRTDVGHVLAHLAARVPPQHRSVRTLQDEQATRAAVEAGFRDHLARAGNGDTALFWFSGHGSQSPALPEFRPLEGTGMSQTLVCANPRHPDDPADLLDVELAVLIRIAGAGGAHVAVVLDCCHADGAARSAEGTSVRSAPALLAAPPIQRLLPELRAAAVNRNGRKSDLTVTRAVVLSACGVDQLARERRLDGEVQGVFSYGLLRLLNRPGPHPTYRDLMTGARALVEDRIRDQKPVLRPITDAVVDQPFLGGQVGTPQSPVIMRSVRDGWEINVGTCHGVVSDMTFGVVGPDRPAVTERDRQVRVVRALTERSVVTPVGWPADPATRYPVVLVAAPMPVTTVSICEPDRAHPPTAALLAEALATAGARGGPSPHLHRVDGDASADIVLACAGPGLVELYGPLGGPPTLVRSAVTTAAAAAGLIAAAEHLAKWLRVKALDNPVSGLSGMARVEVVPATDGEARVPEHRTAMRTDGTGTLRLSYRRDGDTWRAPDVFIRIRNRADRSLYCALLDLTDRYEIDAGLFEGDWIGARRTLWIDSSPLRLTLPPGEQPHAGASIQDWLLLLVAESPFDTAPFTLPRLGGAATSTYRTRPRPAFLSVLESIGLRALHREHRDPTTAVCDWTTSIVPIVTRVPEMVGQR